MKSKFFAMLIFLASTLAAFSQVQEKPSSDRKDQTQTTESDKKKPKGDSTVYHTQINGVYVRPDAKTRFKRYANSVVGPISLARSAATAGLTTARNSPSEWGGKWEGFGRRFASNVGKVAIKNTVVYGLDEALEVDSRYYRSKKKNAGARFFNAIASPVTARNKNGKRVIGIPRIAGSFTSGVIASTTWYPDRYGIEHGLKSGVISLGFNAVFNLFKEFVWKK